MKKRFLLFLFSAMILCVFTSVFAAARTGSMAYAVLYRGSEQWETRIVEVQTIPEQVLTSSPCTPEIFVSCDDVPLSENTDYSVAYFNNDQPGAAAVRVTFLGEYFGYIDVPFLILSAQAAEPAVQPIAQQVYTGSVIEPEPVVTLGETVLTKDMDYAVLYENNIEAGEALALVTIFTGEEETTLSVSFQIVPCDAALLSVAEIPSQNYTGEEVRPEILFSYNEQIPEEGRDYELTFADNIEPGTASAVAVFTGNYAGEREISFEIAFGADVGFSGEAVSDSVFLRWDAPFGATSYRLYRFDPQVGAYVQLCHTKELSFEDKKREQLTEYRYKLVCYGKTETVTRRSPTHKTTVSVGLKMPNLAIKTLNRKVKLAWTKNSIADGFLVYRFDVSAGKQKKIAKITDPAVRTYIDRTVSNGVHYEYFVRSYKKINGKNLFSAFTDRKDSLSPAALLAGVKKQPLTSYPIYNVQGKNTRYLSSVPLSKNDLAILDNFARTHFEPDWTDEQKLRYTLEWINSEVYYPFGKVFEEICSYSHTKAIFECKKGQCLQYNGR